MNNPELYADLEYSALTEQVASLCHSALGRSKARQLRPLADKKPSKAA